MAAVDMASLMPTQQRPKLKPCCKNKKTWLPGTLETTYGENYVDKEVPMERATRKFDGYNIFGNKFDGTTTSGSDYKAWDVKREHQIRPKNTDLSNGPTFAGESAYRQDFGPKEVPYKLVKPKNAFQPNAAPFESETTSRRDFPAREVPAPVKAIIRATNIPTNSGPFAGSSLYKDTFQKQPFARRQPIAPNSGSEVIPSGQFDPATMYGSSFVPKEVARPQMIKPQDARPQSSHEWYGGAPSTEYGATFVGKEAPTTKAAQAVPSMGVLPKGAFNGDTNNRADYQAYPNVGPTRMIRPSPALAKDALPFSGQSTYQSSFVPAEVPYERVRAKNGYEPNTAAFDGTTTHRAAFVPMEVPVVSRAVARACNIKTSTHAFEGASTYKGDFTKMPNARRQQILPAHSSALDGAAFDGTTTYKTDFVEKEVPVRFVRQRDDECESCIDEII